MMGEAMAGDDGLDEEMRVTAEADRVNPDGGMRNGGVVSRVAAAADCVAEVTAKWPRLSHMGRCMVVR